MAFTSYQKKFIKKNFKRLSMLEMAQQIDLSEKEIRQYLKKVLPPDRYEKLLAPSESNPSLEPPYQKNFTFADFFFKHRKYLIYLTGLIVLAYINSLGNDFVSDDIPGIKNNPAIGSFSHIFESAFLFPERLLYFVLYHIAGLSPAAFRLSNVVFHIGSVIVLYSILVLLSNRRVAIIATSLFAIHPLISEAVVWISGGPYVRYGFFFLLSFLFYILSKNNQKYFRYSLLSFVFAILSGEKAIVLALIFGAYELIENKVLINWKKLAPYFLLSAGAAALFVLKIGQRLDSLQSQSYAPAQTINPFQQIPVALTSYFQLSFWPAGLTLYHTELSIGIFNYLLRLLMFLLFAGMCVFSYKKNKKIFFWLMFIVVPLLPFLTPFGISWIVAERYFYLSSIGLFVLVAMLLDHFSKQENYQKPILAFVILVIAGFSIRTMYRNADWKNEDTLWPATLKTSPSGHNIHNNMGDVYSRNLQHDKAIEEFKKAIEINPNYADAYHNLGMTYYTIKQYDQAIENLQKAASINPNLWQSYQSLATIYWEKADKEKAAAYLQKALELRPAEPSLLQLSAQLQQ